MTEETREGVELLDSGAIRVWIEGAEHRLRRPRFREYRQIRELLQDALDEISALASEVDTEQRELADTSKARDEAGEQPITPEERAQQRKHARVLRDRREDLMLDWWMNVGDKLADSKWPSDIEELPVWMSATESTTLLVNHWRSVPSLSGVR